MLLALIPGATALVVVIAAVLALAFAGGVSIGLPLP